MFDYLNLNVCRGVKFATPNMPLWHLDYFRLIIFKKQKTQEVFLFTAPLPA